MLSTNSNCKSDARSPRAFTLLELLVVIAIIGILASLLLSALNRSKQEAQGTFCMNNLKQMQIVWTLYADDSAQVLVPNIGGAEPDYLPNLSWVVGNAHDLPDETNTALLTGALLGPYAKNPAIYRCPADRGNPPGTLRVRSISMNNYMHGQGGGTNDDFVLNIRTADISQPSSSFVFLDESPVTINDGFFAMELTTNYDEMGTRRSSRLLPRPRRRLSLCRRPRPDQEMADGIFPGPPIPTRRSHSRQHRLRMAHAKHHPSRRRELAVKTATATRMIPANRIRQPQFRASSAFTLVELLVVIAIIGILASLLLTALSRAKASALRTQCLSQTKQLALAMQMYAQDNREFIPWPNWGSDFQGMGYTRPPTADRRNLPILPRPFMPAARFGRTSRRSGCIGVPVTAPTLPIFPNDPKNFPATS